MGCTKIYIFLYSIVTISQVSSITTRIDHNRNFRRHTDPPPFTDWEPGLREAVHQALLREHHTDPGLRHQLLEAPFIGRQDTATRFGDIAVLARGQLFVTHEGFKFIQDYDQDNCYDCHQNARCARSTQCQLWKSLGHHRKLIALWTVKRIRHRDPDYGHVFEIEYTISPITSAINEELVRRHGYFDYNVPGHIFVIRSNPRASSGYHLNASGDKWYKNYAEHPIEENQDHKEPGSGHFKTGILIGVGPDGYKQVLHSFPGFYSSYHPHYDHQTTVDPKEYELYKKLIESLASKTSKLPHRFSAPTEKTTVTMKPTYQLTTFVSVPETTYFQLPSGQFVPLTENTVQPSTTQLVTPIKFPSTSTTQLTKYSEPDLYYHTLQTTTPGTPKPITMPVTTTVHYYTPVEVSKTSTSSTPKEVIPTTLVSTRKTTTPQDTEIFGLFSTKPISTTTQKSTTAATEAEEHDVFPVNVATEPMKPVTEIPKQTSPEIITEQLPPPETTPPYTSSTVTQPTTAKTERVTFTERMKTTTIPREITSFVEEPTTVIEQVPYTEQKTTIIVPVLSTQEERTTTSLGHEPTEPIQTTTTEKFYTITATTPRTTQKTSQLPTTLLTSTTPDQETTRIFTVIAESFPPTPKTTIYTRPTTVLGYFDGTTQSFTETLLSSLNTVASTMSQFPTTETVKLTSPATHVTDTDIPKTSTITTERTTIVRPTQPVITTTYTVPEKTTKRTKPPEIVPTTTNDFLVDEEDHQHSKVPDKKDFDENDIFGEAPIKPTTETPQTTTKRVTVQDSLVQDLFGGRRSKQIKFSSKIQRQPVTNTPKIIYQNFFFPSTRSLTTTTAAATTPATTTTTRKKDFAATTPGYSPSTDQSYSTSISFEVNKRYRPKLVPFKVKPTVRAEPSGISNETYTTEMAETTAKTVTETAKSETKKVFDNIALQLVNHARTIDYLQPKPSVQPKYRRRNFTIKRKIPRRENGTSK